MSEQRVKLDLSLMDALGLRSVIEEQIRACEERVAFWQSRGNAEELAGDLRNLERLRGLLGVVSAGLTPALNPGHQR